MSESIYEFLWYVNNIMLALLQGGFLWYNLTRLYVSPYATYRVG